MYVPFSRLVRLVSISFTPLETLSQPKVFVTSVPLMLIAESMTAVYAIVCGAMWTRRQTTTLGAKRDKAFSQPRSGDLVSGSLSHRPFTNTLQRRVRLSQPPAPPSKALPESYSRAIISALKRLQEKMRRYELDKQRAELSLWNMERQAHLFHEGVAHRPSDAPTERERCDQASCNPALFSWPAGAEARCIDLVQQLHQLMNTLRSVKADRESWLGDQATMEGAKLCEQTEVAAQHDQMERLKRLERQYLVLQQTHSKTEEKIRELEMKLLEEEHQRTLLQDKADQLQSEVEANRRLLELVPPVPNDMGPVQEKTVGSPKARNLLRKRSKLTPSHARLTMRDVPFVAGMSVSSSHSVRANIQSVLSLMKQQPPVANDRGENGPDASATPVIGTELSQLLQSLTEELQLMTAERDELTRRLHDGVSDRERRELHREQERLLLKMEMKGEQIHKLREERKRLSKLKRKDSVNKQQVIETSLVAASRGPSTTVKPGELFKNNRRLLSVMKALKTSLQP